MDWNFCIGFFCGAVATLITIIVFGLYIAAQDRKSYQPHKDHHS